MPPATADTAVTAPRDVPEPRGLRFILVLMATIEMIGSIPDIARLAGDVSSYPGSDFRGLLIKAYFVTTPIFAIVALVLAVLDRVRHAIMALALISITRWLSFIVPSIVVYGVDRIGLIGNPSVAQVFAFPLMAICAIFYAIRNERLTLSTLLVSLLTLSKPFWILLSMILMVVVAR